MCYNNQYRNGKCSGNKEFMGKENHLVETVHITELKTTTNQMATTTIAEQHQLQTSDDQITRVHDYLDDKLQNDADLENIDALLRNVLEQQDLLRQQVCYRWE